MARLACKICKRLVLGDRCPMHPDAKLTETWKGKIIVLNPQNSELAKKMKITDKGEYAIRL
jgi:DNA-directed RNA polymerase subunit E"